MSDVNPGGPAQPLANPFATTRIGGPAAAPVPTPGAPAQVLTNPFAGGPGIGGPAPTVPTPAAQNPFVTGQSPPAGGDSTVGPATPAWWGQAAAQNMTADQADAWTQLESTLQQYGFAGADLQALVAWARNEIVAGNSSPQIMLDLEQTPQFAARFPAIVAREKAGLPPITPAEYISNERSYAQLERAAGITPNFADYDTLIANDVSPTEYADRINQGYLAVAQANPDVIAQFQNYYGVTPGQLAEYFLNPEKSAPTLQRQAVAAQIGAASREATFGQVDQQQAMRLAQEGVTYQQAQQGFGNLAQERELYQGLPGQREQPLTQDQLLAGQFEQNAEVQRTLARQAAYEKGTTAQGGKVAETAAGYTGIGRLQR